MVNFYPKYQIPSIIQTTEKTKKTLINLGKSSFGFLAKFLEALHVKFIQ